MRNKIFQRVFWSSMALFILCFLLIGAVAYVSAAADYEQGLKDKAVLVAVGWGQKVPEDGKVWQAAAGCRVIHYAPDGEVLLDLDSTAEKPRETPPEVRQAQESGRGFARRRTADGAELLYAAERLPDGSVICLAAKPYTPIKLILRLFTPLLVSLAVALALSLLLATRMSRQLVRPINEINLTDPEEREVYPELRPLVRRINGQNRQIRRQMEELKAEHERQDAMRREFTANVSHELKTPLTSISGYAELIRDGAVKTEDVPRFGGKIYDEAKRLISLVEDIIRLSQLDSQMELPEKTTVDLTEIAGTVLAHLDEVARQRKVTLQLEGERTPVFGAEAVLYEMIYNLCDNAIKYNRVDGTVTVTVGATDTATVLTVADTGIGIPKEEIGRIFERFYRVDKSHSKEVGGTGLGLSIVKHGAAYHQAQIEVQSTPNEGTAVTVTFPKSGN